MFTYTHFGVKIRLFSVKYMQLCGHRFGVNLHYERKITPLKIFLHCFGVNGLQLCGHRFGVNVYYESKITPPNIFLHCFGVNGLAAVWTPIWCKSTL